LAIAEPRLLKPRFDELSLPQRTALKGIYGVAFDPAARDERGFSEADHFAAMLGYGRYDALGYLVGVDPYPVWTPTEYPEAWMVCGVRAGKSELAAFISTYEATCGGHEAYIRKGKRVVWFQIAQDLALAQYSLHAIRANLESMSFMKGRITAITARRIDLWNGMTIATTPPTVKSVRGYDSPGAVMDEVGVWWQEAESANPDFEIYRQLQSRQAQFQGHGKILGLSSPWNKAGMLWERWQTGTDGDRLKCAACLRRAEPVVECVACTLLRKPHQGRLVLYATTASLGNPLITDSWLQTRHTSDPRAFERENLARFVDSLSGFLDPTLLREAVAPGVRERPPHARNYYVAAIDPAFRRDAFGFSIAHADPDKGVVIDVLRRWLPQEGQKNDPTAILKEIAEICKKYRIVEVLTDQFSIEALKQIAFGVGLALRDVTFTGKSKAAIYGNLQQLLNTKRLSLLDEPESLQELLRLERQVLQGGMTKIAGPRNETDDMATVIALAAHGAVWLLPMGEAAVEPTAPTTQELCRQTIANRRYVATADAWD
jgi:hypothetical protein